MSKYCLNCDSNAVSPIPEKDNFCRDCGNQLITEGAIICCECFKCLEARAKFCPYCGRPRENIGLTLRQAKKERVESLSHAFGTPIQDGIKEGSS